MKLTKEMLTKLIKEQMDEIKPKAKFGSSNSVKTEKDIVEFIKSKGYRLVSKDESGYDDRSETQMEFSKKSFPGINMLVRIVWYSSGKEAYLVRHYTSNFDRGFASGEGKTFEEAWSIARSNYNKFMATVDLTLV